MDLSLPLISSATQRNWTKLNSGGFDRLTSRANKSRSQKKIAPDSYLVLSDLEPLLCEISNSTDSLFDTIFSICKIKLDAVGGDNPNVHRFLKEYERCKFIRFTVPHTVVADVSRDWIGYIYQSQIAEGERNINGQYYTGYNVIRAMMKGLKLVDNATFLDPCCGGGAFLLNVEAQSLSQLYGVDFDDVAVMICKANLIAKYPDDLTYPQIFHADFLDSSILSSENPVEGKKFDYIYTNPPWGISKIKKYSSSIIKSGERASLFLAKSFSLLNKKGELNFLLPSSILKVKAHSDIRGFILQNASIKEISEHKEKFNGVFTDFFSIRASKEKPEEGQNYTVVREGRTFFVNMNRNEYQSDISLNSTFDENILRCVESKCNDTLSHSIWALGIVTGDNKSKLKKNIFSGEEAIYTGKDILPYLLKRPSNYLLYDRSALQQCARDEIYRSPEKLVYKFISKSLCFAYDDSGSLFLNSANILIPQITGMSIKTVLAFLNSELFSFFYAKRYPDIKILKGNLEKIPFPKISEAQDEIITGMVNDILRSGSVSADVINREIYSIYEFEDETLRYIKSFVYGSPA